MSNFSALPRLGEAQPAAGGPLGRAVAAPPPLLSAAAVAEAPGAARPSLLQAPVWAALQGQQVTRRGAGDRGPGADVRG